MRRRPAGPRVMEILTAKDGTEVPVINGRFITTLEHAQRMVGARICQQRERNKWTQDDLAEEAGLDRSHIEEIERGESNFTIQSIKAIADALDVGLKDLFRSI